MIKENKTYRIKATPGKDNNIVVNINQDYDVIEVLSLKLTEENAFKLHSSNYGVVVGRVIANGGFGVPNAKISVFVEIDDDTKSDPVMSGLYPFYNFMDKDNSGKRYNLLPNYQVKKCHQSVGSMPSKEFILNNDLTLEIFEKYYKLTTRTNASGDYMLTNVPIGQRQIHMDVDLSDCGILSQKPRDFLYKGYNIEQFENPNKFKNSDNLDNLSQLFSENQTINVIPFWGNEEANGSIGITRADMEIAFKFEPTCIFMGSAVSDTKSNGISKKCIPTENMGAMDELVSGEGTIEMIRKTLDGDTEELQIKGTELINENGVWCYQIPMNLDYMMTDEYGNLVPSDEPLKGIPTRTRVRFRASMHDFDESKEMYQRVKILIPNNPKDKGEIDYVFGTETKDTSYRDLLWDNVYTIKSYIPRFQKHQNVKKETFTGIKHCNIYGNNNPMPYNNIRIRLPLMFTILCALIKSYIRIVGFVNKILWVFNSLMISLGRLKEIDSTKPSYILLADGLCPDLDGWYFAPNATETTWNSKVLNRRRNLLKFTLDSIIKNELGEKEKVEKSNESDGKKKEIVDDFHGTNDERSIDRTNSNGDSHICLTNKVDYLMSCIEMNLAQEYKVINFDFYNDWVNGVLYFPRWVREIRKKRKIIFGIFTIKEKIRGCMANSGNSVSFKKSMRYTQQCSLRYSKTNYSGSYAYTEISNDFGCASKKNKCHTKKGLRQKKIFGKNNGGVVYTNKTILDEDVFYLKPCEFLEGNKKVNLFSTDVVLLGSVKDCNLFGIPQAFTGLSSSTYRMPTNLALTNMEDAAYYYTNEKGTICSESSQSRENDILRTVESNSGNQNFESAKKAFERTEGDFEYDINDENENRIPITEVAGISWNYSGPGQSENNFKNYYYPGGHFLGLSCVNSETNSKSCVNLIRVCEAGSSLSQRREYQYGENDEEVYYTVPTGLISGDEISNGNFRVMFSTLNSNRLNVGKDKIDGFPYPSYDLKYIKSDGFDGQFKTFSNSGDYNMKLSKKDVIGEEDTNRGKFSEIDKMALNNSFRVTREYRNLDYYDFRFGLNTDDERGKCDEKYLIKESGGVYLPQYENSFYFYFGLREGATALDEFNKQFYSKCEDAEKYVQPYVEIKNYSFNVCKNKCDVEISVKNAEFPYTLTGVDEDGNDCEFILPDGNKTSIQISEPIHIFTINNIGIYDFKITFKDESVTEINNIKIGPSKPYLSYEIVDFKRELSGETQEDLFNNNVSDRPNLGGYLVSEDWVVNFNDIGYTLKEMNAGLYVFSKNNESSEKNRYAVFSSYNETAVELFPLPKGYDEYKGKCIGAKKLNGGEELYLWDDNAEYEMFLMVYCLFYISFYKIGSFLTLPATSFDVFHGGNILSYNTQLKNLPIKWWESDDNLKKRNKLFNNEGGDDDEVWLLKHETYQQNIDFINNPKQTVVFSKTLKKEGLNNELLVFGSPERITSGNVEILYDNKLNLPKDVLESSLGEYTGFDFNLNNIMLPTYWPKENYKLIDGGNDVETKKLEYGATSMIGNRPSFRGFQCVVTGYTDYTKNYTINCSDKDEVFIGYGEDYLKEKNLIFIPSDGGEYSLIKLKDVEKNATDTTYNITITAFGGNVSNNEQGELIIPYQFPIIFAPFYVSGGPVFYSETSTNIKDIIENATSDSKIESIRQSISSINKNGGIYNFKIHNGIILDKEEKYSKYFVNDKNVEYDLDELKTPDKYDIVTRSLKGDIGDTRVVNIVFSEEAPINYGDLLEKTESLSVIDKSFLDAGSNKIMTGFRDNIISDEFEYYKLSKKDNDYPVGAFKNRIIGRDKARGEYYIIPNDNEIPYDQYGSIIVTFISDNNNVNAVSFISKEIKVDTVVEKIMVDVKSGNGAVDVFEYTPDKFKWKTVINDYIKKSLQAISFYMPMEIEDRDSVTKFLYRISDDIDNIISRNDPISNGDIFNLGQDDFIIGVDKNREELTAKTIKIYFNENGFNHI